MFPGTKFKTQPGFGPSVRFMDAPGVGMDVVDYAVWPGEGLNRIRVHEAIDEAQLNAAGYVDAVKELWLLLAVSANGWTVDANTPIRSGPPVASLLPGIQSEYAASPPDVSPYFRVLVYEASTRQVIALP